MTVSWTCFCLNNSSVICTVTLCYVLHQTHSEFWHIQAYSALLSHIPTYWGIIKPYSGLSRHLGSGIFRTRSIFKTLWNFDQSNSWCCHSQNSFFRLIQNFKACICRNLTYSDFWNIQNPSLIHTDTYLEPCHIYENRQTYVTLEIQKPGYNNNPGIPRTLTYLQK